MSDVSSAPELVMHLVDIGRTVPIQQAFAEVFAATPPPQGAIWTAQQVAEECRCGGRILALESTRVVAFLLARDLGNALEISYLGTVPDFRGRGLMRQLLSAFIAEFETQRQARKDLAIWLEVHQANAAARRLYATAGFREVGQRPRYYADGASAVLYNYG